MSPLKKGEEFLRTALKEKDQEVQCGGVGCCRCCHDCVPLLLREEAGILTAISRLPTNKRRRTHQAAKSWTKGKPCPLLNMALRACMIYTSRPMACQALFSISRDECNEKHRIVNPTWLGLLAKEGPSRFLHELLQGK